MLVTRDGAMLTPLTQRNAWWEAGVLLFLLGEGRGKFPLSKLTRWAMFLCPAIVEVAKTGGPGAAWRVAH